MVVKIYISGISGNKEVKKRQQRVSMIMDSKNIKYEVVDIAEPGNEADKDYMQANSTNRGATIGDANPKYPLPPQIYNEADYCGDYDHFDLANENDELDQFLKLSPADMTVTSSAQVNLTRTTSKKEEEQQPAQSENNEADIAVKNGDDEQPSEEQPEVAENGDTAKDTNDKVEPEQDNVENGEDN